MLEDNIIIITTPQFEKKIIEENKLKYNIKIYNKTEFINNFYYKYKNDTLVYLYKKYNLIPEISNIILKNLYKIEDKEYTTDKLNYLKDLKNDLIKNDYLIYNNNFKKFIDDKKIIVYNTKFEKYETIYDNYIEKNEIIVNKFDTIENEVLYVASMIEDLLNTGVDINNIKINKLDSSYDGIINRIFKFFNIPFEQSKNNKLYFLDDIKKFLKTVDYNESIINLNDFIKNLKMNKKVEAKLVDILNKYSDYEKLEDIKEILIYELKNQTVKIKSYTNIIEEIDYKKYLPKDDEYIFVLGFNQDVLPNIHKDDLYLNDLELKEINEQTSTDRNIEEENYLKKFINNTKNLYISYKLETPKQEFGYSNFLSGLKNVVEVKKEYDFRNKSCNELILAENLDSFILYNNKTDKLINLYSNYQNLPYSIYDNNYKQIKFKTIRKQVNNKINLSYTNLTTFYKCQFKFLLDNVYKIGTFKENVSQVIGKLFHSFLEIVYKDNRNDFNNVITEVLSDFYPNGMSKKEEFYSKKYRNAMLQLIEIIKENDNKSKFESTYFEQFFSINKENDLEVNVVGFVDKILTFKTDDATYVVVIDYKTGGIYGDIEKVVYGLDMQLLVYLYLIKNTDIIKNPKYAGMYFQQIMDDVNNKDYKKSYEEQTKENRKLIGYTLSNKNILSKLDKDFDSNSFIRGIKLKTDGEFYSYSKVIDENKIDELVNLVSNKIDDAINEIKNSNFAINPKKIKNTNVSCEYCEYKDICYMNNNNIINYGGEDNNDEEYEN